MVSDTNNDNDNNEPQDAIADPTVGVADETFDDPTGDTDRGRGSTEQFDDPAVTELLSFADMGLGAKVLAELEALGYEEPTPIQRQAIPPILVGRDLIGQARTGTGKTAAFALPIIEAITDAGPTGDPMALVLAPTRELAIQVSEAIHRYGSTSGIRVVPIYGGQHIGRQLDLLRRGVDVVVATPGRALDHIRRGSLNLDVIEILVLDEADEMLDMGFSDEIEAIIEELPEDRQTVLFSATMPRRIMRLAKRHQHDPVKVLLGGEDDGGASATTVEQRSYLVAREHKAAALGRVLDVESPAAAIVFCRTRHEVDSLTESLGGRGYRAEALHGGMSQEQRDRVMTRLRKGVAELLVATDVAARGLDVDHLTHVFNYDVPADAYTYVHRIGRVGRAGRIGTAITFTEPRERRQLRTIESQTGFRIEQVPVPSVSDLRNRRLQMLRDEVIAHADADGMDDYRTVLDQLLETLDEKAVALAALHLAHSASARTFDAEEIPAVAKRPERRTSHRADGMRSKRQFRGSEDRGFDGGRRDRERGSGRDGNTGRGRPRGGGANMTRVYVSAGSQARVRPGDLVGAIANETSLSGHDIGSIQIRDGFSLVEVPDHAVDEVIRNLKRTTLKGRKVNVRRDRF